MMAGAPSRMRTPLGGQDSSSDDSDPPDALLVGMRWIARLSWNKSIESSATIWWSDAGVDGLNDGNRGRPRIPPHLEPSRWDPPWVSGGMTSPTALRSGSDSPHAKALTTKVTSGAIHTLRSVSLRYPAEVPPSNPGASNRESDRCCTYASGGARPRSHNETCAGCTVSSAAATTAADSRPRSTSSRAAMAKAANVLAASYRRR